MRWPAFACCAALGIVLQTTLAPRLAVAGARPDLVFVLVVFFGLYAPRPDAYIAGWVLGLTMDLMSVERLGLFAIMYCAVAVMVNAIRNFVFLKSALTHLIITLLAGLFVQFALTVYRAVAYPGSVGLVSRAVTESASIALYTALCAVAMDHVLLKASRLWGLQTSRYNHRGSTRMRAARV